jgi:3-deoxy-manno-octulosonate cytidylyltransferase (CMP-KDO synthetase)
MKVIIVIPARMKSKRFPGKPIKEILGMPMIIRVAKICEKIIKKENIYIATDSKIISDLVKKNGFNAVITSRLNFTGTDRVAEAASKIRGDIFINVQGDEPLILPKDIKKILDAKIKNKDRIICGFSTIKKNEDARSNSIPKVVMNEKNELIYISRSLIPGSKKKIKKYNKQVCIYAFNKSELKLFKNFNRKGKLEAIEDIEILRFFELKKKILMVKTDGNSIAVDYSRDIRKVEKIIIHNEKKNRRRSI